MMKVTDTQLTSLRAQRTDQFAARVTEALRAEYPRLTSPLSPAALKARVLAAVLRAQDYGLRADRDLTTFARLDLTLGPRFHEHAFFQELLADATIDPDVRLLRIFELATPEDWNEAAALSAGGAEAP